jgi:uncharacterized SAM-binding protein YcdF (DUF218 family)
MQTTRRPFYQKPRFYLLSALAIGVVFGLFLLVSVVVTAKRLNAPEPADTLIVLGAQVYRSGAPSPALKRRLDLAAALFEQGYAATIITTGAQGSNEPMPEADAMKNYLVAKGVPESAVLCDPHSYNTVENITNAKAIMDENGLETAIIVTSDYHLWRTLSICKDVGIPATGAGSQNAETLRVAIRNCLRETVSWIKYVYMKVIG